MDLECQSPAKEHPLPPNPNPNPNPNLRTVKSTAFKREERQKRKERKRQRKLEERVEEQLQTLLIPSADRVPRSDPVAFSDIEWPCETRSDPDPGTTGWPAFSPNPLQSSSAEEQVRFSGPQAQQNGLTETREFLSKNEEEEEEEEEEEDDDEEECDDGIFKFFEGLFENDRELRDFYEKRWEKGEFACLVCERRFANCVGLVQHSNAVGKKRRGAHRALGRAICRALGWDVHRLPGIRIDEPQKATAEPIEAEKGDAMEEEETAN